MKKKLENIWYYYKYYILGGLLALLVLCISIRSCADRKHCDLSILYLTHGYSNANQTAQLEALFAPLCDDVNGDGKQLCEIRAISYGTTVQESNSAQSARSANLAGGKSQLLLMDEQNYNELKTAGFLSENVITVTGNGVLAGIEGLDNETLYLAVRNYDEKRAGTDKSYRDSYQNALKVLESVKKW